MSAGIALIRLLAVLTPKTVLPNVAIVGVIFIAIGIALLVGSNSVRDVVYERLHLMPSMLTSCCL